MELKKRLGRPPKRPGKEVLNWLYWERRFSLELIGKIYGVSREAVRQWLNYYGIPIRDRIEAIRTRGKRKRVNLKLLREEIEKLERGLAK